MRPVDRDVLDIKIAIAARTDDVVGEGDIETRNRRGIVEGERVGLKARRIRCAVEFSRISDLLAVDQKRHFRADAIDNRAIAGDGHRSVREFRNRVRATNDGVVASAAADHIVP